MLEWIKLLAWAEFFNVGLILVAIGIYGLVCSLTAPKPPGRLSTTVRRQIDEVLASCKFGEEDGREDHTRTYS